ncbi:MAG: IS66 family insertion sequence element accessory protein TnpB [Syntrophobacter sp.]
MTNNLSRSEKQQFWKKHIAQWGKSGLSQAEYCRQNKIGLKSFQYWKRRSKCNSAPPALIEVPLPRPAVAQLLPANAHLCVVVGQQYRIEIFTGFESEDLERVVRVLRRI